MVAAAGPPPPHGPRPYVFQLSAPSRRGARDRPPGPRVTLGAWREPGRARAVLAGACGPE